MTTSPASTEKKAPTPLERERKSVIGYLDSHTKDLAIRCLEKLDKALETAQDSEERVVISADRNAFNLSAPMARFFDILLSDTKSDVEVENKSGTIIFSGENVKSLRAASSFLAEQIEALKPSQGMWACK